MIIKLQNGDKLKIGSDEEARRKYKEHSQLSIGLKLKRNLNIASNFLKSGPNITNFGNAVSALFGGFSPENPDVIKGDPPAAGIKNFENLVRTARVAREFNNVINKGLKLVPSKVKDFKSYEDYQRNGLTARLMLERNWLDRLLKDPNSMVHYDNGNHKSSFRKNDGAYIKNGKLHPGQSSKEQTPYIWWGEGGPWQNAHRMFINPYLPTPKRYISIPKDNKFVHVKSATKEIGQNKIANETVLPDEYVTEGPVDLSNATILERSPFGWWERIKVLPTSEIIKSKQPRLVSPDTYPLYRGPRFNIDEIVNSDGTVNPRKAMLVLHTVAKQFGKGAYKMEHRLENPEWHKEDPNTYEHTKRVALSAWKLPTPEGYTKLDLMIAALGHDFGKIISGDGHALIGADLAKQVFIGIKPHLLQAIREHMDQPTTRLGEVTKAADILNGRNFNYLLLVSPELYTKVFIKSKIGERPAINGPVNIFLKPVESNNSRLNVYVAGDTNWKELSYPSYINYIWRNLKNKGIKTESYNRNTTDQLTRMNFFNDGFTPVFKIYPELSLKAHSQEILRRMKNFGLDIDNTMGELPLYGKKSIKDLVTLNSGRTSYVGYYNKPGTIGTFFHNNGTSIVDPGQPIYEDFGLMSFIANRAQINNPDPYAFLPLQSIINTMHHERNMHGTLKFLTSEMWKPYEDFLNKMISKVDYNPRGFNVAQTPSGRKLAISQGSHKKEELRATIGEMVKKLYETKAYAKLDNANVKKYDLEALRSHFEKAVDEMSDEQLSYMLSTTNGYGVDYAEIGPKENPNFYKELRNLLKVAPVALPFLIPRKEEKK